VCPPNAAGDKQVTGRFQGVWSAKGRVIYSTCQGVGYGDERTFVMELLQPTEEAPIKGTERTGEVRNLLEEDFGAVAAHRLLPGSSASIRAEEAGTVAKNIVLLSKDGQTGITLLPGERDRLRGTMAVTRPMGNVNEGRGFFHGKSPCTFFTEFAAKRL
jgi:hypothetical protein